MMRRAWRIALALPLIGATAATDNQTRLSLMEVGSLPVVAAGDGTSGLRAIQMRLLKGNPEGSGLYTIAITVPPNTRIAAHTHRDDRTAVVAAGLWHFGYGPVAGETTSKALPAGSFYTEPAGDAHFAWTGPEGATVYITGTGPSDTHYVDVTHKRSKPAR